MSMSDRFLEQPARAARHRRVIIVSFVLVCALIFVWLAVLLLKGPASNTGEVATYRLSCQYSKAGDTLSPTGDTPYHSDILRCLDSDKSVVCYKSFESISCLLLPQD